MKNLLVRIVAATVFTGMIAVNSFSQVTTVSVPAGAQTPDPLAGLKQALSLTDAQVGQLQNLLQSQMSNLQPLLDDLASRQSALDKALQGSDATAIGNAMLALQASQKALKSAQDANHDALLAVLTAAQKQIVNNYLAVARSGGLGPLEAFGPGFGVFSVAGSPIMIRSGGPALSRIP